MFSSLNPIPAFPEYTGPHKVGTVDVEIPVSELDSPSPAPEGVGHIATVQFRVFYPAERDAGGKRASWLPMPQRQHVSGYTKFIGAGPFLSEMLSFLPRHLYYTSIPAHKNAPILTPNTPNARWPTIIFSHGLGGSRNAYSHFAGSLASHGAIVVCPEHRDGSAVTSYIRDPTPSPPPSSRFFPVKGSGHRGTVVPYVRISHDVSPEMFAAREQQLRIRCWELGLVYEAMLAIDTGKTLTNLNASTKSLDVLNGMMHIHEPSSVIFAGHSFGSASWVQFLKCTYYADSPALKDMDKKPFYTPREGSAIRKQVTEKSVAILLDIWVTPLIDPSFEKLLHLPLPAYDDTPSASQGKAILAVLSDAFYKWDVHLRMTARVLSPQPSHEKITPRTYQRQHPNHETQEITPPSFFYVRESAHLSQSDFGVLFPWLGKKVFRSPDPGRTTRLNVRAQLQFLRENGVPIGRTCKGDLVDGPAQAELMGEGAGEDKAILMRGGNGIKAWEWIDSIAIFAKDEPVEGGEETGDEMAEKVRETDAAMADEIEGGMEQPSVVAPAEVKA